MHVRQLREINPTARIIVTSESFAEIEQLYKAGADYVGAPRVTEATELCSVLAGALTDELASLFDEEAPGAVRKGRFG